MSVRPGDRKKFQEWEQYGKLVRKSTTVDWNETPGDQADRIARLKGDWKAFMRYYFPHYTKAEFAWFQETLMVDLAKRERGVLADIIARDHAKTATAMMATFFMVFTGKARTILLSSYNEGNAINLLTPFRIQLESNERIKRDFGQQQSLGAWEAGDFTTLDGVSFRAIGSGQSPRGARNDEARPDLILVDDFDEDEQSRNPKRVREAFEWLMGALFPTMSITGRGIMLMVGNIIAPDTVLAKVEEVADWSQRVNIYDEDGNPSWPERFTREECQYMIDKLGYRLSQREYFNNPITEGKVFKGDWMPFAPMLPLAKYRALVAYLDPGFKKTKSSDTKAWVLVGLTDGKYHIIRPFVAQASVREMIAWGYEIKALCDKGGASVRLVMEEVFLQDLLYDDFAAEGKVRGVPLPVRGDKRKKPDKDARIEATAGHFERGHVLFNQELEQDAHMRQLREQYLSFEPGVRTRKDGPDAVEGAMHLLQSTVHNSAEIKVGKRTHSSYRV